MRPIAYVLEMRLGSLLFPISIPTEYAHGHPYRACCPCCIYYCLFVSQAMVHDLIGIHDNRIELSSKDAQVRSITRNAVRRWSACLP